MIEGGRVGQLGDKVGVTRPWDVALLGGAHSGDAIRHSPSAEAINELPAVLAHIAAWRPSEDRVLVIAVDGYGASGKSTWAAELAARVDAAVVHTDDFFHWPSSLGADRSMPEDSLEGYYDTARLRSEAVDPLRQRRPATFCRFDRSRNEDLGREITLEPRDILLVEGVFSAAPQLADLVDRAIFVDTPEPERLRRLRMSVAAADWSEEWLQAERAYFQRIRPPSSFDLLISGTRGLPARPTRDAL
jgi:uridine kinase